MAIIEIVNVSTPNDGLGDPLRTSQVKANDNFAELNAKKVEVVAGFDLSENNFTDTEKAKLAGIETGAEKNVQANWNQTDNTQDDYIIGKPTSGKIITYGAYSLVAQNLTISSGWVWQINDMIYTNTSNIVINFPYASAGNQRFDLVVFDTLNSAQRVEGIESVSSPVAPVVPEDTLFFSISLITDATVGSPSLPATTGVQIKDFPRLLVAQQNFTITTGKVAKWALVNYANWVPLTSNNSSENTTFTQSGNVVTFKTIRPIGNYIVIFEE